MANTKLEQTTLIRPKGRPEYGRKLVNSEYVWASNNRRSRSVWTTKAENDILKEIMEIFKNDPNYKDITLGDILARYLATHKNAEIKEHEIDWKYKPFEK